MDGYIERQTLQDIADAIREKNGSEETYKPSEMAEAIRGIEGGGGELSDLSLIGWDVNDIKGLSQNIVSCIAYSKSLLDTWNPSGTSMQNKYNGNQKMVFPPKWDTSKVTKFTQMFANNSGIISIPCYDTSKAGEMYAMFNRCSALVTIPLLDTSTATNMELMFAECKGLKEIPLLNTQNVTTMAHMFVNCVTIQTIPPFNTSKVKNFYRIFDGCTNLVTIPLLDASSITNIGLGFRNTSKLEYFGGLKNLKVPLSLSTSTKLTHDSLMNVINNLYDLASNGLATQTLTLGETNLAKLTEEEQAIAVNKGWTLA